MMKLFTNLAIVVTLAVLVAIPFGWINFSPHTIEANDIGDYLGGVFSPLAFLWLVLGYELQRRELVLTRDQLEAQATELERQASATTQMLQVQLKSLQRDEIRDKSESLPQRVAKLISCYKPFYEIGNPNRRGISSVRFTPHAPSDLNPEGLKRFCDELLSVTTSWNRKFENDHGPLPDCLRAKDSAAFARLEVEHQKLSDWWAGCRQLSRESGMESLAALGEQCGIEELLKAASTSTGIIYGHMDATLAPVTGTGTATVK